MVSYSLFSLSLTLAYPNLLLAAPSTCQCLPYNWSKKKLTLYAHQPVLAHQGTAQYIYTCAWYAYRQEAIKEFECPLEEDKVQ